MKKKEICISIICDLCLDTMLIRVAMKQFLHGVRNNRKYQRPVIRLQGPGKLYVIRAFTSKNLSFLQKTLCLVWVYLVTPFMLETLCIFTYINMVLILDCNSEIGAHVRNNLCYLNCIRHLSTSRAVRYWNVLLRKDLFSPCVCNRS